MSMGVDPEFGTQHQGGVAPIFGLQPFAEESEALSFPVAILAPTTCGPPGSRSGCHACSWSRS